MRWIPLTDLIPFLTIPLLITLGVVCAVLTPQYWDPVKIGFAIGVPVAAWLIAGGMILMKWRARPTFQLPCGTKVWTNNIPEITPQLMQDAIDHYMSIMHARCPVSLEHGKLTGLIAALRVEFTRGPVTWVGASHNYAGLQSGTALKIHWQGGFRASAFWHELIHAQRQLVHGLETDYRHEDSAWWDLISFMKSTWKG